MRISVIFPLLGTSLLVGVLAAPARAERMKRHGVAATVDRPRADASGPSLTTGDLRLTGGARRERQEQPEPGDRLEPFLAAGEVAAQVRPYAPEIERCYLERLGDVRRAGHLDLTLVIGRDGGLVSLSAAAPGLPDKTVRKVESCIREVVDTLHFPERRNDTTAIVPYYFQHTHAPGAGPQLSCWNPWGCSRPRAAATVALRAG